MRRSEIPGLSVAQAQRIPADRLWVRPRRATTDQAGAGAVLTVPFGTHPVTYVPCAWLRWLRPLAAAGDDPRRTG